MILSTFIIIIIVIIIVCCYYYYYTDDNEINLLKNNVKCFVINLASNNDRYVRFNKYYNDSDLYKNNIICNRFDAINGRTLTDDQLAYYVQEVALQNLYFAEKNSYRRKHYELTKGAVGCYLSHLTLYEQLLNDDSSDYYLIFEDDCIFNKNIAHNISTILNNAPNNWDMIIFGAIRSKSNKVQNTLLKYNTFWGLCCYVINKRGARKIFEEYLDNKITMQIDSVMSVMSLNNRLNIYGPVNKLAMHGKMSTDIQTPVLHFTNINPDDFLPIDKHIKT